MIKVLYFQFPDTHFYIVKDSVESCAASLDNNLSEAFLKLIISKEDNNILLSLTSYRA